VHESSAPCIADHAPPLCWHARASQELRQLLLRRSHQRASLLRRTEQEARAAAEAAAIGQQRLALIVPVDGNRLADRDVVGQQVLEHGDDGGGRPMVFVGGGLQQQPWRAVRT
jgi:hypothetical protein